MDKNENTISISVKDFTTLPGARYITDGDGSAQEFFNDYVIPELSKISDTDKILIDYDGTWGYASSFISEMAIQFVDWFESKDIVRQRVLAKTDSDLGLAKRFWDEVEDYEYKKKK